MVLSGGYKPASLDSLTPRPEECGAGGVVEVLVRGQGTPPYFLHFECS